MVASQVKASVNQTDLVGEVYVAVAMAQPRLHRCQRPPEVPGLERIGAGGLKDRLRSDRVDNVLNFA